MFVLPNHWVANPIHVVLAGAGGSGSEVLDGLARIDRALRALGHPGFQMSVFDPETVSLTNTVRQRLYAPNFPQVQGATLAAPEYRADGTLVYPVERPLVKTKR